MKAETTAELEAALQRQTQQHVSAITTTHVCCVISCCALVLSPICFRLFVLLPSRVALRFALI